MIKVFFAISCLAGVFLFAPAQAVRLGCTDPQALNFDSLSFENDGSCRYQTEKIEPSEPVILSESLSEISGIVFWKGYYWGHNDGGNGALIYRLDTLSGKIRKVIGLRSAANVDWEDMAQDQLNFYIGDFGNNAKGNRTDLMIYKVPKRLFELPGDTVWISAEDYSIIRFVYEDQSITASSGSNNTPFDCEAMFFYKEQLHLITKNWIGDFSVHYVLPAQPGSYRAKRLDSLFTGGFMVTGADITKDDAILLTAYNRSGACRIILIFGIESRIDFFKKAHKRFLELPSGYFIGQLEAICIRNDFDVMLGSERILLPTGVVPQNFRPLSIEKWVAAYYRRNHSNAWPLNGHPNLK